MLINLFARCSLKIMPRRWQSGEREKDRERQQKDKAYGHRNFQSADCRQLFFHYSLKKHQQI